MSFSSKQSPAVSVVIPAYNAERYLEATLASIQAQSVRDIEILVVDDCSRDSTMALVQRIGAQDPRVQYLRTPTNCGGPAGPRNRGVAVARAEWLALCDADDIWHPRKLELQLKCAEREGVNFVCSQITDFHGENPPPIPAVLPSIENEPLTISMMLMKNRVATSSVLCRRILLTHDNGFDTSSGLVAVEDFDMWLRLLETREVDMVRILAPLVYYRRLPNSLSRGKLRQFKRILKVLQRHFVRRKIGWLFPIVLPLMLTIYISTHIWFRVVRGRI